MGFWWDPCGLSVICWIIKVRQWSLFLYDWTRMKRVSSVYRNIELFLEKRKADRSQLNLVATTSFQVLADLTDIEMTPVFIFGSWLSSVWSSFHQKVPDRERGLMSSLLARHQRNKDPCTRIPPLFTEDWYWIVRSFTEDKTLELHSRCMIYKLTYE